MGPLGMPMNSKTLAIAATAAVLLAGMPWFVLPAAAQDADAAAAEAEGADTRADTRADETRADTDEGLTAEEERLADAVGADEEGASGDYEEEEDDDFVPTQEVSSDQSVNFPVDI